MEGATLSRFIGELRDDTDAAERMDPGVAPVRETAGARARTAAAEAAAEVGRVPAGDEVPVEVLERAAVEGVARAV